VPPRNAQVAGQADGEDDRGEEEERDGETFFTFSTRRLRRLSSAALCNFGYLVCSRSALMMRVTRLRLALRRSVMAGPHAAAQPPTLRALSSASSPPSAADEHPDEHQSRGDVAAGLPDFIHAWGPGRFKKGGYALAAFTAGR